MPARPAPPARRRPSPPAPRPAAPRPARRGPEARPGPLRPPRSAPRARPAARPGPARRPGGPAPPAPPRPGAPGPAPPGPTRPPGTARRPPPRPAPAAPRPPAPARPAPPARRRPRLPRLGQPRLSLRRRSTRLPRLGQPRLGLLGAGLKPGPGLLGRRDLRFQPGPQPGLSPARHPGGPAPPAPPRPGAPGPAPPGPSLGRPGLRAGHRLVPLLPRRGHLLLRGPRLLLGGGRRLPRLGQPRLGLLGAGLKPGPGLFGRRDLRLEPGPQPGLVPLGVPAGLRHLLLRGPAHPVQLRPGRLGRPGLRAGHRLVPFLPRRGRLLPRGPRLLLGGGRRLPRLGQPRLGLLGAGLKPGPGLLGRRDLRLEPGPQPGLVPLGVPAGLRHLLLRGPAHPVQLRPGRLGRPGLRAGPTASSRSCRAAATCSRARLLGLGGPCLRGLPRGHRLLLGGGLRLPRLGQPRLSLRRRSTRLPRISLGPLAAPPEREPRPTRVPRVGRPATLPGQHLAPPERGQRQMRLPGHRVRQPAVPLLCRPRLPWPRLILTARIGASEDFLTGLNHRQAPFRSPGQRSRAAPGGGKPGTSRGTAARASPPRRPQPCRRIVRRLHDVRHSAALPAAHDYGSAHQWVPSPPLA